MLKFVRIAVFCAVVVVVSAFMFVTGYDTCYFLCLLSLTGLVAVVSAH